jgi:ribonuclease T1
VNKKLKSLIFLVLALGLLYYFGFPKKEGVPDYVLKVLEHVDKYGEAPEGYVGGRKFGNFEKRLPEKSGNKKIYYKEWDVHPKVRGKNRGPERLVTGNDNSAYYTPDHYETFTTIR